MITFLGFVVGLLTLMLPPLFWSRNKPRLSSQDFVQQHPDKKRIYYLHLVMPVAWILFYALGVVPILLAIGDDRFYLISFTAGGGLALGHGIVEILTGVSMRNFSRGGPATYLVDNSVRQLGWMRVGIVFLAGLIPLSIINLWC